ncbi:MAG: hypothetical protein LBU12_07305 [Deltaproteobacteria bacterium]|jgi:hypothetical protein|nr:hypothetical protein [Deltaproteobacteria bacterium]
MSSLSLNLLAHSCSSQALALRGLAQRDLLVRETEALDGRASEEVQAQSQELIEAQRTAETEKTADALAGLGSRFRTVLLGRLRDGADGSSEPTAEALASMAVEVAQELGRQKAGEFMSRTLAAAETDSDGADLSRTLDDFFRQAAVEDPATGQLVDKWQGELRRAGLPGASRTPDDESLQAEGQQTGQTGEPRLAGGNGQATGNLKNAYGSAYGAYGTAFLPKLTGFAVNAVI